MRQSLLISVVFILLISNCKKDTSSVDSQIFVPTAFTPNGDKKNDSFVVKGSNLVYFSINIYDKNNNLVFSSTDINISWDGNYNGKPAPADNYTWIIEYKTIDGVDRKESGYVALIR